MSNILKGIINETSPHDYDSDWDYQDAVARSGKSRSGYRSQEDDTSDADIAYSKKMYQLAQKQKRDSDHDRLASGTNEDITETSNPYEPVMIQGYDKWLKLVNIPNVDKHAYKSDITAVTSLGDIIGEFNKDNDVGYVIKKYVKKGMAEAGTGLDIDRSIPGRTIARISGTSPDPAIGKLRRNPHAKKLSDFNDSDEYDQWSGKVGPSIHDDEEDTFDTDYTGDEDGTLKEISNEKLAQYKTAAALDAGKADKEGDYKRGDKRFSGIVKATKKQFANDTKKSGISQGINEFSPGATGPKGPKDYGQPNSSRYIGGNKFVVGTTNNYVLTATIDKWGLEWDEDDEIWFLDSPGAAHIADASEGEIELPPPREQRNQIHDLVTDYLNERNSADLQKVAAYYGHSNDGEMATNEAVSANRFNSKQEVINHFVKNGKSAAAGAAAWERGYRGSSKKPIELKKSPQKSYHDELDDKRYSTFETVGDHLKSTALDVLVKAKLEIERHREAIEKQHEAEGEAYKQDLIKNNASRLPKQNIKTFQPIPVLKPDENPDVLRDRLQHLDIAKQKFQELNELIDAIKDKYPLVADKLNQLDNSLLQDVKDGPADNYKTLLIKLTQYKSDLGKKYPTAVAYLAKKNKQGVDEDNNSGRMRMKDYYELADAIQEKLRQAIKMGDTIRMQELNKQRDELDARVKKHGMMPESVDEADMNRRGFLGNMGKAAGAGALAAAGLGGAGNAQAFKGTLPARAPSISEDEAETQIKELRNKAYKELASMVWGAWPSILDTTFGGSSSTDKPATPEQIGKMLGYRLAEYADDYRQKVRAIKVAAGVRDPQSLNKTNAAIYINEQEEQLDELKCWSGYHRVAGTKAGFPGSCAKNKTNEEGVAEGTPTSSLTSRYMDDPNHPSYKSATSPKKEKTLQDILKDNDFAALQIWAHNNSNNPLVKGASAAGDAAANNIKQQLGLAGKMSYEIPASVMMDKIHPVTTKAMFDYLRAHAQQGVAEAQHSESCPHCGGEMVSEELMNEKKDACYYKVKSRYKVWPSAYASGALVKCRNKGASNWGNGGKKNESSILEGINRADESLHDWFNKEKWVRMDTKGKIKGPCAREPGEGKPKCLPQSKAHSLGKKGRASAAQRKRREDPNPDRSGKAINVNTKKKD